MATELKNPIYLEENCQCRPRKIVVLTLLQGRLVRTIRFENPKYLGDPINAVRIFNNKGIDEMVLLEIDGAKQSKRNVSDIIKIATEAFFPLSFGGGIQTMTDVHQVFQMGFEKVILNSALHENSLLAGQVAAEYGSQAVVAAMEVFSTLWRGKRVSYASGKKRTRYAPKDWARRCEDYGCGELIVNSIERDGCMEGYDLEILHEISQAVSIPVIPLGGAGSVEHLRAGLSAGASAVAAGSMFVLHGPRRAVLITYPEDPLEPLHK